MARPRRIRGRNRHFGYSISSLRTPPVVCASNLQLATHSQFVDGTFLRLVRISMEKLIEVHEPLAAQPPQCNRRAVALSLRKAGRKESNMDAKYNWLIDNAAVRLTLNTVALALWLAMAVGLLELASKV